MSASPRFSVSGKNLATAPFQTTTTLTRLIGPPFCDYRNIHMPRERSAAAVVCIAGNIPFRTCLPVPARRERRHFSSAWSP
jgi:hypothetical protein